MEAPKNPWTPWEENFRVQMRTRREALGLTQTDLARAVRAKGVAFHQQTVQRIESGDRPVRLDEAFLIADELSFSVYSMVKPPEGEIGSMYTAIDRLRRTAVVVQEQISELESDYADAAEYLAMEFQDLWERDQHKAGVVARWSAAWMLKAMSGSDALSDALRALNGITTDDTGDWTEISSPIPNPAGDFRWLEDDIDVWKDLPEEERPAVMADLPPIVLYDYVRDYPVGEERNDGEHPAAP